jgi:hypothetical protein
LLGNQEFLPRPKRLELTCQVREGARDRATLIIKRIRGGVPAREVHRDESMSGGHVWDTPMEALWFAMQVGQRLVRDPNLPMRR